MRISNDTLPPYGPAAQIYRSANRNLAVALLLFGAVIACIVMATIPALDVGAAGFGILDFCLGASISVFLASLLAIMLMYVNDAHAPNHLIGLAAAMHAAAFGFLALLHFSESPHIEGYSDHVGHKVCFNERAD